MARRIDDEAAEDNEYDRRPRQDGIRKTERSRPSVFWKAAIICGAVALALIVLAGLIVVLAT